MKDKNILLLSLLIYLVGTMILTVIIMTEKPKILKITELKNEQLNKKISILGEVISIRNYSSFQIIQINDKTGKIEVFSEKKNLLKKGDKIVVTGRISEYNNTVQIKSTKINSLKLKLD